MRVVHKFVFNREGEDPPFVGNVMIPAEAVILHVAMQRKFFVAWMLVESEVAAMQEKHFLVVPTGAPIPVEYQYAEYITTIHEPRTEGREYIWHVFDVTSAYNKTQNQS